MLIALENRASMHVAGDASEIDSLTPSYESLNVHSCTQNDLVVIGAFYL